MSQPPTATPARRLDVATHVAVSLHEPDRLARDASGDVVKQAQAIRLDRYEHERFAGDEQTAPLVGVTDPGARGRDDEEL